jgi:hypothetical protein
MPRRDRTGPMGEGPMTGWGDGLCSGNPTPVYRGRGYGRGYDRGFGRGYGRGFGWGGGGRGWRKRFRAVDVLGWGNNGPAWPTRVPLTPEQETDILKAQAKDMEESLGQINQRLKELEKEKK